MDINKYLISENMTFKKGDKVNFHNDLRKLTHGKITQVRKVKDNTIYTIDTGVAIFKRSAAEVYEF